MRLFTLTGDTKSDVGYSELIKQVKPVKLDFIWVTGLIKSAAKLWEYICSLEFRDFALASVKLENKMQKFNAAHTSVGLKTVMKYIIHT